MWPFSVWKKPSVKIGQVWELKVDVINGYNFQMIRGDKFIIKSLWFDGTKWEQILDNVWLVSIWGKDVVMRQKEIYKFSKLVT